MNEMYNEYRFFDEKIISTEEFQKIALILKQKYDYKIKSCKNYNYNEFKNNIVNLVVLIMKNIIKETKYKDDEVFCIIKKFCIGYGSFNKLSNTVTIKEEVINRIYNGDIVQLIIIFHEIYHFVVKYDILNGKENEETIKILKEKLVYSKIKNYKINNYRFLYEEKYVDIKGINEFLYLINILNINLSKKDLKRIENTYNEAIELYNYNKRIINTITNRVNFDELFESMIKKYPEWLNYPLIEIEYNNKIYVKN